jgi:hypothetical protein
MIRISVVEFACPVCGGLTIAEFHVAQNRIERLQSGGEPSTWATCGTCGISGLYKAEITLVFGGKAEIDFNYPSSEVKNG